MITVVKLNPAGEKLISYTGEVRQRLATEVVLDATWTMAARELGYTTFEPGDHFIEYYYSDRWYNIFEIADSTGERKGWYCNIAEPARFSENQIEQVDLLLDVWVTPAGEPLVLDEDEFAAAQGLSDYQRQQARQALQEILLFIARGVDPFNYRTP
ncbi:MAG TPA: DUF402 domain-containing protein [Ktedonobacteraceae bacterium]|nr:DUF402 domain-containing protein [Ktedonobacteraceae bacterium]